MWLAVKREVVVFAGLACLCGLIELTVDVHHHVFSPEGTVCLIGAVLILKPLYEVILAATEPRRDHID